MKQTKKEKQNTENYFLKNATHKNEKQKCVTKCHTQHKKVAIFGFQESFCQKKIIGNFTKNDLQKKNYWQMMFAKINECSSFHFDVIFDCFAFVIS